MMYVNKIRLRKHKEIERYLDEAETRVSWARKTYELNQIINDAINGESTPPDDCNMTQEEWLKNRMNAIDQDLKNLTSKNILGKIGRKPDDPLDGHSYDYWNGVMAALRWVVGMKRDSLNT